MGRPPLPIGTFGTTTFLNRPNGKIQARAWFRDHTGRTQLVSRLGASRAAAERALKIELASRQTLVPGSVITPNTTLDELADVWLAAARGWSTGTERTYASVVRAHVKPVLGRLRVREVTPGVVSRAVKGIAERSGPSAARTARACLSGMFSVAIEGGAAAANPVRDSGARLPVSRKPPRALSQADTDRLTHLLRTSERADEVDLADIVDWMLATGCRIGEALALRETRNADHTPVLDLAARTWEVNATVVRVGEKGLQVQPRPKTAAGWRTIALPDFALRLLADRRSNPMRRPTSDGLVFHAPLARSLRDPSNVSGDLRQLLDSFDCEACARTGYALDSAGDFVLNSLKRRIRCDQGPWSWVTSHTFRKTVATRLEEAGFTPRQVADQLGHANPSMTLDVYFGRRVVSAAAAEVLDRADR